MEDLTIQNKINVMKIVVMTWKKAIQLGNVLHLAITKC